MGYNYAVFKDELGARRLKFFVLCNNYYGGGGVEGADKMGSVQNKTFKMPKKQNDRY